MSDGEPTEREKWEWEQRRIVAGRLHDREHEFYQQTNQATINNSNATLRLLVLINGGAALALLTFLSGLYPQGNPSELADVAKHLIWFVWGVAFAAVGSGLAYAISYCIVTGSAYRDHKWYPPYVEDTPATKWWIRSAIFFHLLAVIAAIVSLGLFVYGMLEISDAIIGFLKKVG